MGEYEAVLRKWGNSYGILVPKEVVQRDQLKENTKIWVLLAKPSPVLAKTFGTLKKWKRSSQTIKNQLRKELYD